LRYRLRYLVLGFTSRFSITKAASIPSLGFVIEVSPGLARSLSINAGSIPTGISLFVSGRWNTIPLSLKTAFRSNSFLLSLSCLSE
jgi:hypothetical protein